MERIFEPVQEDKQARNMELKENKEKKDSRLMVMVMTMSSNRPSLR